LILCVLVEECDCMSECTHKRTVGGKWVANPDHNPEEWELGGFDSGPTEWQEGYEEDTVVDVDLHRYKCTQCGKMMYYSQRAKNHFENGAEL
jgi:hypothetical protein